MVEFNGYNNYIHGISSVCVCLFIGHVTDDWDRRLLLTYINDFFKEDAISLPFYKLSSLATYYVPKVCSCMYVYVLILSDLRKFSDV